MKALIMQEATCLSVHGTESANEALSDMAKAFLKEHRKKAGLTQETAAHRMGISREYLSKLESGKGKERRRYNQDILEDAAAIYHCTVADLFRHPDETQNVT